MLRFSYTAFNPQGRQQKGQIDAVDLADARRRLRADGLSVSDLKAAQAGSEKPQASSAIRFGRSFNTTRFFADLSVLMNAGLGVDQALRAMQDAASRTADRQIIGTMIERLSSGATPSVALSSLNGLPEDAIALISSGEHSARLPYVMKIVAADLEKRDAQRKQLIDASVYPLFLLAMMFLAIGVVTFVLVPTLEPIFESSGRNPPFIVAMLSSVRGALGDPAVLLTIFAGIVCVTIFATLRPSAIRTAFAAVVLKLPFLGRAISQSALARYLQSLSLLLDNAVPLPDALALSARCCPAVAFRENLLSMRDAVISGKRLPEAFNACGLFPRGIVSLVSIGDEVNKLPTVLDNAAGVLRSDAQRLTDRLLALMTPLITIFLGILIGGLVVSVMTALLGINELSVQ
jgi:general secretion pathway protein F